MPETIVVREFEDHDLGQVLDVLKAALGETHLLRRTPELFSWKHIRNPFGRSLILVATSGSRIAGVRAFMRWQLVTPEGQTLQCVRAVDTATHPDFHRQGIFSTLTTEAVDRVHGDGVDLIFNTPNPKSAAGYLKMGWVGVGPIGVLARPSLRVLRSGHSSHPIDPERFLASPRPAELGNEADCAPLGLRTPRTDEYRAWRFEQHPTARYFRVDHAGGSAMLRPNIRNGRRELVVSEISGANQRKVLRRVIDASRADYLAAWWSKGTPERRAARQAGMVPIPKMVALNLVCRPLRPLTTTVNSLASWDLALSDLELL